MQYPISSTGHALCWYATAEKFYDENEKEISEYFDNLCSECDTSGTDFIKMSVTEILSICVIQSKALTHLQTIFNTYKGF